MSSESNLSSPLSDFYKSINLRPVEHDISTDERYAVHERKRRNLIEFHLKLPFQIFKGARVLEFGAATGENALVVARNGARMTVVEPIEYQIEKLKTTFSNAGLLDRVEIHNNIVEKFTTDKKFDMVIAEGFLHCVPNRGDILRKLCSFVDKDGFIFLSYVHPSGTLIEFAKRAFLETMVDRVGAKTTEEKNECARAVFLEDFQKINHSRNFEAWVWDSLLIPLYRKSSFWGLDELMTQVADDFYVYSSWPNYLNQEEMVWHKNVRTQEEINRAALNGYYARYPHFIHAYTTTDVGGLEPFDPKIGKTIQGLVETCLDELDRVSDRKANTAQSLIASFDKLEKELARHRMGLQAATVASAIKALFTAVEGKTDRQAYVDAFKKNTTLRSTWGSPYQYCVFHRSDLFTKTARK